MTMSNEEIGRKIYERVYGREPRMTRWRAEDGWIIGYTTERMGDEKFGTYAYKPTSPTTWELVYERHFVQRKAAKARALVLYGQHSPKWKVRRG